MTRIALYPGTFDPLTNGHLDIISRASKLADKLIIGVAMNERKSPLFSLEERQVIITEALSDMTEAGQGLGNIEVQGFRGLLTDFARDTGATMLVRGLRAVADFEYEFQMATANKRLHAGLETVFLTASEHQHFVASHLVKEIARYGGDISSFVPQKVAMRLIAVFKEHQD